MDEDKNEVENRNGGDFPIREINGNTRTKNISPFALPHFHGLTIEDPHTFFFEFVSPAELMIIPLMNKVLLDNQPPYPHEDIEKENEESDPKVNPPIFPERLIYPTQHTPKETKLLGELKNLFVRIPLLQAIKDVHIYNKLIKEKCFKHPTRIKKDTPTINSIGQFSYPMPGRVIFPKYVNPGSHVVDVHIDGIIVPHTFIDLVAAINVMTKETMLKLNLQGSLRKTTTILQLADKSTTTPQAVVEDVMVSIDSWAYPADFLVLQPKTKFHGYPLILGRPWLSIVDSYINCRTRNMTIKNGHFSK
eukprot:PITA_30302